MIQKRAGERLIVMGDFNAKIARSAEMGEASIGNERGEMLLDFALSNNLKIVNMLFRGSIEDKWTWKSPIGGLHEIDYFMVEQRNNTVQHLAVMKTFKYDSDHRMLMSEMKLHKRRFSSNKEERE
ncbi:uncharacterized protein LOC120353646 [Nilaparvata lugens]|uniref:uncharacterized protein LOC120353646 n=1 Tax=Nilaparvata lugens TaxID=108931 RepID=UPI00193D2661|nr:uncharacterized protein LOC120353646 [Nilaparvata lugens]